MWIFGVFFGLAELGQGLTVPPCGKQSTGKGRASGNRPHLNPTGWFPWLLLRYG